MTECRARQGAGRGRRGVGGGRGLAALALLAALAPPPPAAAGAAGKTLAEALDELAAEGLRIVYSSDLVKPEMRVLREPAGGALHQVLEELLAPHGLTAEVGPGGRLLVVRAPRRDLGITILRPEVGSVTAGEVEVAVAVSGAEGVERVEFFVNDRLARVVEEPPFRARLELVGEVPRWRLRAVAHGSSGSRASAAITTRNVVVREELDITLRELAVTVEGASRGGRELGLEDFRVREDGQEVRLAACERGDVPVSTVLLLDASQSMAGPLLREALAGVRRFLLELDSADEAMLLLFADGPRTLTPFSRPPTELLHLFDGVEAGGDTALADHLYAALELVGPRRGRPVVLLVSDGADVLSALRMRDILWKVHRTEALLYWIRVRRRTRDGLALSSAWWGAAASRGEIEVLEKAVAESGGRIVEAADAAAVAAAFSEVLRELREQYILSYYPRSRDGEPAWRPVEVEVDLAGARLRYRPGYFDG